MTIHELVTLLNTMEPDNDVFVACFKTDGLQEIFDIEAVHDHNGHAQLDIYEEKIFPLRVVTAPRAARTH